MTRPQPEKLDLALGQAGFSLLEALVALIIASILCVGILGAQFQSFKLATSIRDSWAALNFAEELLARQYPDSLAEATPMQTGIPWLPEAKWGLSVEEPLEGVTWRRLTAAHGSGELGFDWPTARAAELKGLWPGSVPSLKSQSGGGSSGQSGSGQSGFGQSGSGQSGSGQSGSGKPGPWSGATGWTRTGK